MIWGWFLEEAVFVPGLLDGLPSIDDIDHKWTWQPLPNLDEVDSATAAKIRLSSGQSNLPDEYSRSGKDFDTEVSAMAKSTGLPEAEVRRILFMASLGADMSALLSASSAASSAASGEYTEIGQRAYNNNQKRIQRILDAFSTGDMSEGRARIDLAGIGLAEATIRAYINDARDAHEVLEPERISHEAA